MVRDRSTCPYQVLFRCRYYIFDFMTCHWRRDDQFLFWDRHALQLSNNSSSVTVGRSEEVNNLVRTLGEKLPKGRFVNLLQSYGNSNSFAFSPESSPTPRVCGGRKFCAIWPNGLRVKFRSFVCDEAVRRTHSFRYYKQWVIISYTCHRS